MRIPRAALALALASLVLACESLPSRPATGPDDLPYPAGSLQPLREPGARSPRIASYVIDARLDDETHRITATSRLTWKHTGNAPVSALPFHLYLNAFKNETSVFMRESGGKHRGARASDGNWGWIDVESIKLGETELRPGAKFGEDETTLEVPLPAPVAPGETVTLDFKFTAQLPEVFARTGWKRDFTMVGQWFPKIGVLESAPRGGQRFVCDTFHLAGEFYADFGVYDVTIDAPAELVVAATGVLTGVEERGEGRRVWKWRAEDVHDFAWMADPRMEWSVAESESGVTVIVYSRPEQRAWRGRHLAAATRTIDVFSRLFYPYPWSVMTVIDPPPEADGSAGGMEYPTLVTTAADRWLTPAGVYLPEQVTVHEVGHNWFQGILASDEQRAGWLDEGLNEYADGVVLDEMFGENASLVGLDWLQVGYYPVHGLRSGARDAVMPIDTVAWKFPGFGDYGDASYAHTTAVLKTLEQMVGRERFLQAMGHYARKWAFKHPTGDDFIAAISEGLGEDVRWFLEPALRQTGGVDLVVRHIKTRRAHEPRGVFGEGEARKTIGREEAPDGDGWISEVMVVRVGPVPVETDVLFRFEDGSQERRRFARDVSFEKYVLPGPHKVVEAVVDPDGKVLLEEAKLDNALRTISEASASWRAAARVGFWQQTLMQVVGL